MAPKYPRRLFRGPRLLPELIDAIIDHLHNDKVSLQACSLVCKEWTRSARYHLFSVLHVDGPNAKRWLKRAPAQVIIPFVRNLLLGAQKYNNTIPLLVGFERVRWLHLDELRVESLNARALSALFCNFSSAVEVRLDLVTFASASQLVRFICAFPCLQTLAMKCVETGRSEFGVDSSTPTTFRPSPHLRVLELYDTCIDAVLDWFIALPDPPALRAVGLHTIRSNNSVNIANLLSMENSLEKFLISTAIAQGPHWPFDLRRNPRLRSVQIDVIDGENAATLATQMLSQASEAPLEVVVFTLGTCEDDVLERAIWDEIDAALQHPSFSGLKTVEVLFIPMEGFWGYCVVSMIMDYMPRCLARGILRVRHMEWQYSYFLP